MIRRCECEKIVWSVQWCKYDVNFEKQHEEDDDDTFVLLYMFRLATSGDDRRVSK